MDMSKTESGSVPIVFAMTMIPLFGLIGAAVDYSSASAAKAHLDRVLDGAVLAGVGDNVVRPELTWAEQKKRSHDAVEQYFTEQVKAVKDVEPKTMKVAISQEASTIRSRLCYEYTFKSKMMKPITIGNCAEASSAPPTYISIQFLVDASGSMGIGASVADQNIMTAKNGCAFACHTVNWMSKPDCKTGQKQTTYCATLHGAKTRFEVVKDAIITVLDEAKKLQQVDNQYEFGVSKFSNFLTPVTKPGDSVELIKGTVKAMQPDAEGAGTNLGRALTELKPHFPKSGDGKSPETRKVFLVLMTDGVEGNVYEKKTWSGGSYNYFGHWDPDPKLKVNKPGFKHGAEISQVIDHNDCTFFKNKNVTVLTLNTEYITPPGSTDPRFKQIQSMLVPVIKDTMKNCATTPDLAFYATTPGEIQQATKAIFNSIMAKARIVE